MLSEIFIFEEYICAYRLRKQKLKNYCEGLEYSLVNSFLNKVVFVNKLHSLLHSVVSKFY